MLRQQFDRLDPNGWSWLSTIRDTFFDIHEIQDEQSLGLSIDALEKRLAQVGNMLLTLDELVANETHIDLIRATIASTVALLSMTEQPFATLANRVTLLKAATDEPNDLPGVRTT